MWYDHIPNHLKGEVEEWFYECMIAIYPWNRLDRKYIGFDEFMHYWNMCVTPRPEEIETILSIIKMPIAITANICHSHWEQLGSSFEGFTFEQVLSYKTKELDLYKILRLAAKKLGKDFPKIAYISNNEITINAALNMGMTPYRENNSVLNTALEKISAV